MRTLAILCVWIFFVSCGSKTADNRIEKFEAALGEPHVTNLNAQTAEFERHLGKTKFKDYFEAVGSEKITEVWRADSTKINAAAREKIHGALRVVANSDSLITKYLEGTDAAGSLSASSISGGLSLYANDGNDYFAKRIWVINSVAK